jgi:hypothetical protein
MLLGSGRRIGAVSAFQVFLARLAALLGRSLEICGRAVPACQITEGRGSLTMGVVEMLVGPHIWWVRTC